MCRAFFLFLAVLGLRCCTWAFSSCSEQGLFFIVVCGLLSTVTFLVAQHGLQAHGLQQLWLAGARAQAQQLWRTGLVALQLVGSSQTRNRTHVPCIGRQILKHCTTREVPDLFFFFNDFLKLKYIWDFPGGPVVRTLCFHCRGTVSIPGRGTKIPRGAQRSQKKIFF